MVKGEKREEKGSEDAPGAGSQSSWEHETVVSNAYRITPEMQEAADVLEIHPQGIIYLSGPLPTHRLVFSKLRANLQPDSNCPHRSRQAAALQKNPISLVWERQPCQSDGASDFPSPLSVS